MKNNLSDCLYVIKGFAIISVAAAHLVYEDAGLSNISNIIGGIGVPVLLILSGYFFKDYTWREFARKKTQTIIVPWIVYGLIVWITAIVLHGYDQTPHFLRYLLGIETWLYFVPVLLICMLICQITKKNAYALIALFVIWLFPENYDLYSIRSIYPYLVPLYHLKSLIGYYIFGVFIQKFDIFNKLYAIDNSFIIFAFVFLSIVIITFMIISNAILISKKMAYFISSICFLLLCINVLKLFNIHNLIINIGKNTYFIYFIHMQYGKNIVELLLSWLILNFDFIGITVCITKPVLVVLVTYLLLLIFKKVLIKLKLDSLLWLFAIH